MDLKKFFKKGIDTATAEELFEALTQSERERQQLREREQALALDRQRVLLSDDDSALDGIEAELVSIQRAAERHDIRIPELRRLRDERFEAERAAADKALFEETLARRLKLCERIDTELAGLGSLFAELDATGEVLRGLGSYFGIGRLPGSMGELRPDRDAMAMAVLAAAPSFARALGIEEYGPHRRAPYGPHEAGLWAGITASLARRATAAAPAVERAQAFLAETANPHRRYS